MHKSEFITVIIRAYNRKDFLIKAVDSALNQTLEASDYEVIVVKNWKDEIIDNYLSSKSIKVIFKDGIAGSLIVEGLKASAGNVICFLDDDDQFMNMKLETVYRKFYENKELTYYHNGISAIKEDGSPANFKHDSIDFGMSNISIKKLALNENIIEKISFFQDAIVFSLALNYGGKLIDDKTPLTFYLLHSSTSNFENMSFEEYKMKSYKAYQNYLKNAEMVLSLLEKRKARRYMAAMICDLKMGRFQFNPEIRPDHVFTFITCKYIPLSRRWIQFKSYIALKYFPRRFRPVILRKREHQFNLDKNKNN